MAHAAVATATPDQPGYLAHNLLHFGRLLRAAGLPIGPDRLLLATQGLELVGLTHRSDVHAALCAVMVDRHEHQALFDQAFAVFWRDPTLAAIGEPISADAALQAAAQPAQPLPQRLLDGLAHAPIPNLTPTANHAQTSEPSPSPEALVAPQASPTQFQTPRHHAWGSSERERLSQLDFRSMSADEFAQARQLAHRLPLPIEQVRSRRHAPSARGQIDLPRALRRMARSPFGTAIPRRRPRLQTPPLVVLIDISGSMQRYARIFLHVVHALTLRHRRIHTLTFGTRLTNITRCLRHQDPDIALQHASHKVADWSGGTRIADCLATFNQHWARRLLGHQAGVLLLTDGLERDDTQALQQQMAKLRLSARQIVWLNPLLRFQGFEPKAAGIRAMLPFVDRFIPAHNLNSLAQLGLILADARQHHDRSAGFAVGGQPQAKR